MSISSNKKTLALAAGAALTASLALSPTLVSAETSPFSSAELTNGYMQVAGHDAKEAKCGEGKCGEGEKAGEAKCGEAKCGADDKAKEAKCGEGKCGAADKAKEAKCGEGKCGGDH